MRITSHVWRAAEASQTPRRYCGRVSIAIHLKGCSDECIHGILSCQLAEDTIGAETAVAPREKDIWTSTDIFIHPHFTTEGVDALDPTALDGWNQRWMGVQSPVFADLSAESQRL